jgi:DNA-binding SARP family transcriptional activator
MIVVRSLGPAEILVDGEPAPSELLWKKNLALLLYLARSPERRRSREHIVGLLWGDKPDSSARHSLNEALWVIRRAGGEKLVESAGDQLLLSTGSVAVDTDLLAEHMAAEDWEAAATLVRGPFLEGFAVPDSSSFEDWLAAERRHWTGLAGEALRRHADARLASGDTGGAREAAARALSLDAHSDEAVRLTMLAAALRGERAGALAVFDKYALSLAEELGIEPEPETGELAERIRNERTWRLPETVPESELWARRLPLVGREAELASLVAVLRRSVARSEASLLIVHGESGVGKTRLGEEATLRARLDGVVVARIRAVPTDADSPWSSLAGLAAGGLWQAEGATRTPPEAVASIQPYAPVTDESFLRPGAPAEQIPFARAFAEVVRAVATIQPVLLWIDGAEHMDTESATALPAILRDLAQVPCSLLLTAASFPPTDTIEDLRARVGMDVPGRTIGLGPLSEEDVRSLAALILPDLDESSVERLARRITVDSAGLPLFAVELLNAVRLGLELEELRGWPQPFRTMDQTYPGDLPDSVTAAIRIGFRRLGRPAQQLLTAASVLPERPDASLLGRATGLAGPVLDEALDELEWNRWLTAEERGYTFVARIVRDVVARDMLTPGQRQRIVEAARP